MADDKKTAAKATKPKAPPAPPAKPSTPSATETKTAATDGPRIARVRAIKTGFDHTHSRRRPGPTVFDLPVDAKTGKLPSWVVEVTEEEEAAAAAADEAPAAGSGATSTDGSVI